MSSGFRKQFDELRAKANSDADILYSLDIKPLYSNKGVKDRWLVTSCLRGESPKT